MRQWQGIQRGNYPDFPQVGKLKTHNRPQEDIMQTALPQLPEVGKTYISQEDPTLSMYVEEVMTVPKDEFGDAGFFGFMLPSRRQGQQRRAWL